MRKWKAPGISNIVDFFPDICVDPTMTATEKLSLIMFDVLQPPPKPSPIFNSQQELATVVTRLKLILGRDRNSVQPTNN